MARIVILAPLLPEARAVARAFSLGRGFDAGVEFNENIAVVLVGPRAMHLKAAKGLEARGIILAGLGGGLSSALGLGDLVIDQPLDVPTQKFRVHHGNIHTSSQVVTNPQDKMALFRQTGALAVDMESEPCRAFAQQLGVPFLTIRAISDTAQEHLGLAFLGLVDDEGRPRVKRALGLLARHPGKLPALLHIGRATKLALSHLTAGVAAVVGTGWPGGATARLPG